MFENYTRVCVRPRREVGVWDYDPSGRRGEEVDEVEVLVVK